MTTREELVARMLSYPLPLGVEKEIQSGRMYRYIDLTSASFSRLPTLEEAMPFYLERVALLNNSGARLELLFGRPSHDPQDPLALIGFIGFRIIK